MNKVVSSSIEVLDVTVKQRAELKKELDSFYLPYKKKRRWLKEVWTDIKETAVSMAAEFLSGALGHGPVGTYPDLPFLHWKYRYEKRPENEQKVERHNYEDYHQASKRLYGYFSELAGERIDLADGNECVQFDTVSDKILAMLKEYGSCEARYQRWVDLLKPFSWYSQIENDEVFHYDRKHWNSVRDSFQSFPSPNEIIEKEIYHFYQAASYHRHYVLRELLPEHGIVVV